MEKKQDSPIGTPSRTHQEAVENANKLPSLTGEMTFDIDKATVKKFFLVDQHMYFVLYEYRGIVVGFSKGFANRSLAKAVADYNILYEGKVRYSELVTVQLPLFTF